jgi:hypothetical protein
MSYSKFKISRLIIFLILIISLTQLASGGGCKTIDINTETDDLNYGAVKNWNEICDKDLKDALNAGAPEVKLNQLDPDKIIKYKDIIIEKYPEFRGSPEFDNAINGEAGTGIDVQRGGELEYLGINPEEGTVEIGKVEGIQNGVTYVRNGEEYTANKDGSAKVKKATTFDVQDIVIKNPEEVYYNNKTRKSKGSNLLLTLLPSHDKKDLCHDL